jgi:hypothetical protein
VLDLDGIPVRTINLEGLLRTKQTNAPGPPPAPVEILSRQTGPSLEQQLAA